LSLAAEGSVFEISMAPIMRSQATLESSGKNATSVVRRGRVI
jgi:hypothetical protein